MNINDFRAALKYGGGRTNLFKVQLTNPVQTDGDRMFEFMCRSASIPQNNITALPVSYFGRSTKVAGIHQNYDDWTVTIINDEDFLIRNALETWSNAINSPIGNTRRLPTSEQSLYKSTATITAYSQTGIKLRQYKFEGIFPISLSEIQMDWQNEAITEFTAQFSVDYVTTGEDSITGFAGGIDI